MLTLAMPENFDGSEPARRIAIRRSAAVPAPPPPPRPPGAAPPRGPPAGAPPRPPAPLGPSTAAGAAPAAGAASAGGFNAAAICCSAGVNPAQTGLGCGSTGAFSTAVWPAVTAAVMSRQLSTYWTYSELRGGL